VTLQPKHSGEQLAVLNRLVAASSLPSLSPGANALGLLFDTGDMARKSPKTTYAFEIEVTDGEIVIGLPLAHFRAVYYKPPRQPQLILRQRTKCDDWELLTQAYQAAVKTARELGWIA
jgi:hypothetical protein